MRLYIFLLLILLVGCAQTAEVTTTTKELTTNIASTTTTEMMEKVTTTTNQVATFTIEEISKHSVKGDCWLLMNSKVYDVSEYSKHPGGDAILAGCGKDATELFETRPMGSGTPHSDTARGYLDNFLIGEYGAE